MLEVVSQCGRYKVRLTSLSDTTLSFDAPTQVAAGSSCDVQARTVEAELSTSWPGSRRSPTACPTIG